MTAPADTLAQAARALTSWYEKAARPLPWRDDPTPYRVWVSEIMLQQTRIEAVKPYFARFMAALPSVEALASAPEEQVLKLWEGLGYYSRARNLHRAAKLVAEELGGKLPSTAKGLLTLPGVGPYTAGAIASIAFGELSPAVDGNVLRVLSRLLCREEDITSPAAKKRAEEELSRVMEPGRGGALNEALMELGETLCIPGAPRCGACPLETLCLARARGMEGLLPIKKQKKPRRIEERTVFALTCGGRLALRMRPEKGLLAGLWELPSIEGFTGEDGAREALGDWGLLPLSLRRLEDTRHIFTHLEWHMQNWAAEVQAPAGGFTWVSPRQLREEFPLPSAFSPQTLTSAGFVL